MADFSSTPSPGTGSVVLIQYHGLVENNGETITHFTHTIDLDLYKILENLYLVCIVETTGGRKKVVAGFVAKTNLTHNDTKEFPHALKFAIDTTPNLQAIWKANSSVIPAKLGVPGDGILTEEEFLRLFATQAMKIGV